MKILLIVNIKD